MHKKTFGRKLSRDRDTRKALFRSLSRALVLNGKIVITKAKAKSIQGQIDKLVTWVKKNDVVAHREVFSRLGNDREVSTKLFVDVLPLVGKRNSGFTRITNSKSRSGDAAQMVTLEWVDKPKEKNEKNISA